MGVLGSFTKNFTNCQVLLRTAKKIWRVRTHLTRLGARLHPYCATLPSRETVNRCLRILFTRPELGRWKVRMVR
jgi:hypothetical protein